MPNTIGIAHGTCPEHVEWMPDPPRQPSARGKSRSPHNTGDGIPASISTNSKLTGILHFLCLLRFFAAIDTAFNWMNSIPNIIFTIPRWEVSGVTTVNLNLAAALRDLGAHCRLLMDEDNRVSCPYDLPSGISCQGLSGSFQWECLIPSDTLAAKVRMRRRQAKLRRILAGAGAPVVLIPGYAQAMDIPSGLLGKEVGVLGVVHSDDETNIGFAVKHGSDWIHCVCVSERVARRVKASAPWLEPVVIPNGVPCSCQPPPVRTTDPERPLRVIYAGRLAEKQKRILDLPEIVEATSQLPIQWEIAGEGPEAAALQDRLNTRIQAGTVRWHGSLKRSAVCDLFRQADIMVMLSAYEGMPMSLLEAMSEGCVPVVSEGCDAGADLVRSSNAGFVLPTGDLKQFAHTLEMLARSRERLAALSAEAWAAIKNGPHNAAAMGAAYHALILDWLASRPAGRNDPET